MLLEFFIMLGLVLIGFFIAEFQNAYLGNQEKSVPLYFSFIGVYFTQKDLQRLLFAFFLALGIMFSLPTINELVKPLNFEVNGYVIYLITGYAPSTVMFFIKKKTKEKLDK